MTLHITCVFGESWFFHLNGLSGAATFHVLRQMETTAKGAEALGGRGASPIGQSFVRFQSLDTRIRKAKWPGVPQELCSPWGSEEKGIGQRDP